MVFRSRRSHVVVDLSFDFQLPWYQMYVLLRFISLVKLCLFLCIKVCQINEPMCLCFALKMSRSHHCPKLDSTHTQSLMLSWTESIKMFRVVVILEYDKYMNKGRIRPLLMLLEVIVSVWYFAIMPSFLYETLCY